MLWLCPRPAATALIRPLAWEPPYAAGVAQEMAKRQKKKRVEEIQTLLFTAALVELTENPKESTDKLLELISEFSKIIGYKVTIQK